MLELKITPRFNDTDGLGHINHAQIVTWFEEARRPLFKLFIPDLDPKNWNLILARIEVDYLAQMTYMGEVEVKTCFEKLGNSSITIQHEAWQDGVLGAKGRCVMVHFDYKAQKSLAIPAEIRRELEKHMKD